MQSEENPAGGREDADREFLVGETKLEDFTEDAFGHEAYVDTLEKIVMEVSQSWHIALYGTWGAGKSSIVNLLYKRVRASQADGDQYPDVDPSIADGSGEFTDTICVSFDAWKHAEDSLRTELLLDLNQSLQNELDNRFGATGEQDSRTADGIDPDTEQLSLHSRTRGVLSSERLVNELYNTQEITERDTKSFRESLGDIDNILLAGLAAIVVYGLVLVGFQVLGNPLSISSETFALLNGLATAILVLGGGNALLSSFLDELREARRDVNRKVANPQNEWSGAYENLFNAIVSQTAQEYARRHPADDAELEQILITIDDIDRCQSQTALEILIGLKSFLSHDRCVYIVPCDEDALYEHLEAADDGEYLSDAANQQNFLAKFFETELEIPTPSEQRLDRYFEERREQFDRAFDPRSLEVLQQANLDTPRRITRALNRLVVLEELAENRGVLTEVDPGGSEVDDLRPGADRQEGTPARALASGEDEWNPQRAFLAVVSILQTDYARLHAALERDPELLDELYEHLEGGFVSGERQGLDPLFDSLSIPEGRRDPLVRFLERTRDVADEIDSPGPYLRLTGRTPSPVGRFKSRFDRGRTEAARELIEVQEKMADPDGQEGSEKAEDALEEMTEHIAQKLSEESAQRAAFPTAVGVASALRKDRREKVAEAVISALKQEQPQELLSEMRLSEFEDLLDSLPPDRTRTFLKLYVQSVVGDDGLRSDNFTSLMEAPGELLETPEIQQEFAETIHTGRRRGHIRDTKLGAILADVREEKPELYTPELIRQK